MFGVPYTPGTVKAGLAAFTGPDARQTRRRYDVFTSAVISMTHLALTPGPSSAESTTQRGHPPSGFAPLQPLSALVPLGTGTGASGVSP